MQSFTVLGAQHSRRRGQSSGCCRPLLHALLDPGVAECSGVELDKVKVVKAEAFFALATADLKRRRISLKLTPTMHCSAIEQVGLAEPAAACVCMTVRMPV